MDNSKYDLKTYEKKIFQLETDALDELLDEAYQILSKKTDIVIKILGLIRKALSTPLSLINNREELVCNESLKGAVKYLHMQGYDLSDVILTIDPQAAIRLSEDLREINKLWQKNEQAIGNNKAEVLRLKKEMLESHLL